jgi:tol-pal system protein YbgF
MSASRERGTVDKNGVYTPPKSAISTLGSVSKTKLDQMVEPDAGPDAGEAVASAPSTPKTPDAAQSPAVAQAGSVLPAGTPRERYQYAFGLMSQARYDEAEAALKEFIAAHGTDPLVGNARYWLGETYYVRNNYMDAAQTFFQAYKTAPDGSKAPDSLLKLGMSMASLDKPEEACATFGKLRKEYTDLKPSIEKALNRETKRLKCQ